MRSEEVDGKCYWATNMTHLRPAKGTHVEDAWAITWPCDPISEKSKGKWEEAPLKERVMIHKIKAHYDEGNGLKIRAIERQLCISRNTVRKYLGMDEAAVEVRKSH